MANLTSSPAQNDYSAWKSYPQNLSGGRRKYYPSTLERYEHRLHTAEANLFLAADDYKDIDLPIRDLYKGKEKAIVKERKIQREVDLESWLDASVGPVNGETPKCRFIYVWAENSRDRLRLSGKMFSQLMTYHQVMPSYLDFVLAFGAQEQARDLRFGGFRESMHLQSPSTRDLSPGVSGQDYQMCFNLKGVTWKPEKNKQPAEWSIRQVAIHHQFDIIHGTTVWIITKGGDDLRKRFKYLTAEISPSEGRSFGSTAECFRSSLSAHLLYCQWSTEDWHGYLCWLEKEFEEESSMAIHGPRGPGTAHQRYEPRDIQKIQYWKDRISEVVMLLKLNVVIITKLRDFYTTLLENKHFPLKDESSEDVERFTVEFNDVLGQLTMNASRAQLLKGIVADRKELIVHHLGAQASERTEELTLSMERETVVMRIITIVTLLYLPATFVSTFFSTDIVKYQNVNGGTSGEGSFSSEALSRWLQVTIPLMFVTICGSWVAHKFAERSMTLPESKRQTTAQLHEHSMRVAQAKFLWSKVVSRRRRVPDVLPRHEGEKGSNI